MMIGNLKKTALVVIWGLLLAMPLLLMAPPASAGPKPIVFGHLGEWTGPAGRTCGPVGDALILYVNEIINKEKGGIPYKDPKTGKVMGKVKVKIIYADCRYELPLFKSAFRNFVDKGAVLVHTTSSPAVEGLKKDYKRDKVPCLISTATTAGLYPPGWIFGTRQTFAEDVGIYVNWIKKKWKKKRAPRLALMYYDGPFGRSMLWGGPEYAKKHGFKIVADEPVTPMPVDMSSQLLRIKQARADFIIANCLGSQAAVILKDMRRLGIKIPFCLLSDTDANELVTLAGKAAEGARYTATQWTAWDESRPSIKRLNENYRRLMRGKPGYDVDKRPSPDLVWGGGWLMGIMAEEVFRLTLEKVSPGKITGKDVLEHGFFRMKDFQAGGLLGGPGKGITYKPWKDHRGGHHTVIHQVRNMRDHMATGWIKAPVIPPPWMKKK